MLEDRDGNIVKLGGEFNDSVLITGKSGTGKTTLALTHCLELATGKKDGKRKVVYIIDYSDSYTKKEIDKYGSYINEYIEFVEPLEWKLNFDSDEVFLEEISECILDTVGKLGCNQKAELMDSMKLFYKGNNFISLQGIVNMVKGIPPVQSGEKKQKISKSNIINNIYPYKDVDVSFVNRSSSILEGKVYIIQLSKYRWSDRMFLARLLTELIWRETMYEVSNVDAILIDECHHMPLKKGSTLSNMLKEGRRRGLSVIISTQSISQYKQYERSTLMQAANRINLRSTDNESREIARKIAPSNIEEIECELRKLSRGQGLISGSYTFNNGKLLHEKPIVVEIIKFKE